MVHQRPLWLGLLLGGIAILPLTARADFFIHSWENQYENKDVLGISLNSTFYNSTSNIGSSGTTLVTGLNYSRLYEDVTATAGLTERLSVFGRLSWSFINQSGTVNSGSGYGLGDQSVGMDFRILGDSSTPSIRLDAQIQGDIPIYALFSSSQSQSGSSTGSGSPSLGDGSTDLTGGLFLSVPLSGSPAAGFWMIAGAGYTYRTAGFSAAVPWRLRIEYRPDLKGFYMGVASYGIFSLDTDSVVYRSSVGSAGSLITGAVNPTLIQLGLTTGYRTSEHFEILAGASETVGGESVPDGFQVNLFMKLSLGSVGHQSPTAASPLTYKHSNGGFVNYSLDARVLKSNDRLNLVKIDKGGEDGIEVGQVFDIFQTNPDGTSKLAIARGEVAYTKSHEAVIRITEFFEQVSIDPGFAAKRLISKEGE